MKISVNAQSSIKIESQKVLRFDPYKINEMTNDADYIFITHAHSDHFSLKDIERVKKTDTKFIVPKSMLETCIDNGLDLEAIIPMSCGEIKTINDIKVEAIAAYNVDKPYHLLERQWLGYCVNISGVCIYVSGDTDVNPHNSKIACDIAIIPIGGTYTMNAKEAAKYINRIKPKKVIPTHYKDVGEEDVFKRLIKKKIEVELLLHRL